MEEFQIPEDVAALDNDQLAEALAGATEAFQALASQNRVDDDTMGQLRALSNCVQSIRQEQADRIQAAERTAQEIEELAAQVRGEDPQAAPAEEPPAAETTAATEQPAQPPAAPEAPATPAAPTATASIGRTLDLSLVRARQPRVLPEPAAPGTVITAAVDVPGYTPGAELNMKQVVAGLISRANALKTAGGGTGQVISYHHPYPEELIVTDSSSAPEGTEVALRAADQSRLPQQNLVASGGWCAPSETVYELTSVACPDMLWDAPEIQLARGGLRYYTTPSLDVAAMTWVHTESDDISGATKPCFKIPCPDPVEMRCDAVGVCLEAGILTQRHFPELINWYLRNALVAHEIRLRSVLFAEALASATAVTLTATFGALAPVFAAVALQSADMIERHSFCDSISLEVVFPWWSRQLFLADIARRNGCCIDQVSTADVQDVFTPLGVRVQWARNLIAPTVTGATIGQAAPATAWPANVKFLIYPAGQLQIGRGEEVNLGVIHDSVKFSKNDYTAMFSEECVGLIDRSVDTRLVTVPVCPDGSTGAQEPMTCPAA
ncbi:major capsid protein [Streptomyces sp. NPDC046881]|uniref:major capsid protein n=1 Tax=Streptomyces sp. NPDC046881 TaxID=3155374 RepID=UPI0034012FB7